MPLDRLTQIGLTYSEVDRAARRRGISIKLTSTQATLLRWYCDAAEPTLEACCADNWQSVSPDWVRGQWEKLGTALAALGLAVEIDQAGTISLIERGARQVAATAQPAPDDALQAAVRRLTTERDEISALLGAQRDVTRRLRAEADRLRVELEQARQEPRGSLPPAAR